MKKIEHQPPKNTIKSKPFDSTINKKSSILPLILVFCIPVFLYLQTLKFGLTYFDDNKIITNHVDFLSHFGNSIKVFQTDAFMADKGHFYRPLQTLSYMTDIQLSGGDNAWMYHFTNILLLGLIACLIYLLLRRFLIPFRLALLSTLVYCTHPLFVSTVAWIPARGDLLLTLFSLLSFLFLVDYLQKKQMKYLVLHWAAFTLALFCKETAVFLPFLFIIYYFVSTSDKRPENKYLITIMLYGVSGVLWFWLRLNALKEFSIQDNVLNVLGQNEKFGLAPVLSNLRTIPESLAKFFIPIDIAPIPGFTLFKTLIGSGIIILIIIMFYKNNERSKKEKLFCFSWFLLLLLPTMVFKHQVIDYLDHRFFLPMIGILLFVLFTLPKKWFEKGDIKKPWLLAALVVFLSCFTFINSHAYSDKMNYYNAAVTKNPDSAFAYNNRGAAYHNQGSLDEAIKDYTRAIELKPDYAIAYYSRGNAYFTLKSDDKAIADYTRVIELNAGDANTYNNRGSAYCHLGLFDKACPDFKQAEKLGSKGAKINIARFCNKK